MLQRWNPLQRYGAPFDLTARLSFYQTEIENPPEIPWVVFTTLSPKLNLRPCFMAQFHHIWGPVVSHELPKSHSKHKLRTSHFGDLPFLGRGVFTRLASDHSCKLRAKRSLLLQRLQSSLLAKPKRWSLKLNLAKSKVCWWGRWVNHSENPAKPYKKRTRRETHIADIFEDIMWAGMEATDAGKKLLVQVQILNHPRWNDFHQTRLSSNNNWLVVQ